MNDIIISIKKNINNVLNNISKTNLVKILNFTADKYYNGNEVISDNHYDLLYDKLKEIDPNNKFLKQIGFNVHTKNKIKLPYHMGSMDKIKAGSNLINNWKDTYKGSYVISDKLDGVSGLFVIDKTGLKKLYTRGNGTVGTDISSLIPKIKILNQIFNIKDVAIRGEFIISKKNFKKYKDINSNPRALVSGLINKKTINKNELDIIDFIAYEVIKPDKKKMSNQLHIIDRLNLKSVHALKIKDFDEDFLSKYLLLRKEKAPYEVDGLVIYDNNIHSRNKTGNPKYAFAFKDTSLNQTAIVEVIKIEWNISKDGLLKPRIFIKPVKLSGVIIKNVTGFNAKYILDNDIGKESMLKIIRSGDVIPHIVSIEKRSLKADMPNIKYKWNKTKVDIIIDERSKEIDNERSVKNITYFLKTLEIKNIDTKIVEKLVENNINTIKKIINIKVDDFLKIEGFKEKLAEKLSTNIQNGIKDVELVRLMSGTNIFGAGFGIKKFNLILDKYPNILKILKSKDEILKMIILIDGFEEKTAKKFVDNLDKFKKFLKDNPNIKVKNISKKKKGNKYLGKTIVFSGFRDKELEEEIISEGGKVTTTITSNTDLLIVKDINENSSKIKKAKALGIRIIEKLI
tara:strand:- start:442 stop:2322 length:1881 start_codon:yes stop_codon:yes gene_type:complete